MRFQRVNDLGKVIAIRLKRLTKNRRTQLNSSTTDNLEVSTNVSFARHSKGVSLAREASDMAQVALPFVQAIAGAIPLVGAPMQAAIGGLMTSLQAIDNKSDLVSLTLRLNRLSLDLCNAPPARDPVERSRRDSFVRMLEESSARVTVLHERCLASTSVTQAIAGCFIEIDRYLADYLLLSQIQSQHDIHEELVNLRRQQEDHQKLLLTMQNILVREQSAAGSFASHLNGTIALGCVTLVDATGHHHAISVNFCTSFQQLNMMLPVLFQPDSTEARIQRWLVAQLIAENANDGFRLPVIMAVRSQARDPLTLTPITWVMRSGSLFATFMSSKVYVIMNFTGNQYLVENSMYLPLPDRA
ncbi:hypothetical protein DEU56DRAFT_907830 [Suillus clintonianus]|uniref:uncharacterized protein n=1 Tax=Suillus clintonianus TaxID=1904413 RepID=UPI001B86C416|nr:uncharacterized protein DEU56DRAFT_907830 [Suillus clintonianus]KAG2153399.1 hypothetical protein DEU56DRAFT_907830 [Suillus clintonianus]